MISWPRIEVVNGWPWMMLKLDTDDEDYRPEDKEQSNREDGDDGESSSDNLEELLQRDTVTSCQP